MTGKISFEALFKLFDHKWVWGRFRCPKCKKVVCATIMMEDMDEETLRVKVILACPNKHGYKFGTSANMFLKMISTLKLVKRTTNGRW